MAARTSSPVFADVCDSLPQSYWDYENFVPEFGTAEDYEAVVKVGRGKYSEVFQCYHLKTNRKCIVKILKPIRSKKISREILILQNLSGGKNIIQLLDAVLDTFTNSPCLVFEHVNCRDYRELYASFNLYDISYYMFQLLSAVQFAHERGIFHRDLKPQNIMIDHEARQLRVIDWGLAEFYHANKEYNVRVASRYFKGPELLVGYRFYDYSLDLWSFGCILASLVFNIQPFFRGYDNEHQLVCIARVLGSEGLYDYVEKYDATIPKGAERLLTDSSPISFMQFVNERNVNLVSAEVLDLIEKVLVYDHHRRLTAKQALEHPFFNILSPQDRAR